jgi:DNA-directed RNA polymerase subunit M/transcription elongation factor TFIIS
MTTTTIREAAWICTRCGYLMDAASLEHGNGHAKTDPEEGDYALCFQCGECHTRHGAWWQPTTAAELADMHPDNRRQIAITQATITLFRAPPAGRA